MTCSLCHSSLSSLQPLERVPSAEPAHRPLPMPLAQAATPGGLAKESSESYILAEAKAAAPKGDESVEVEDAGDTEGEEATTEATTKETTA